MDKRKTTIHVWSNGVYMGNIMYTHFIPQFSEEEFEDTVIEHFPHLKGKRWRITFS